MRGQWLWLPFELVITYTLYIPLSSIYQSVCLCLSSIYPSSIPTYSLCIYVCISLSQKRTRQSSAVKSTGVVSDKQVAARERRNAMRSRLKEMMKAQAAAKRTGETESVVETGDSGSIEVSLCNRSVCVCVCVSIDLWLIFAYTVTYCYVCVTFIFMCVCVCVCLDAFMCIRVCVDIHILSCSPLLLLLLLLLVGDQPHPHHHQERESVEEEVLVARAAREERVQGRGGAEGLVGGLPWLSSTSLMALQPPQPR